MTQGEEIIKEILARGVMLRIGQHVIVIIKKRIAEGIFEDGSTAGNKYSTTPFSMPVGAIQKKSVMMKILKDQEEDDTELYKSKSGKLWVIIKHGYEWLRRESGKPSAQVDFRWTGELMRSMTVLKSDPATGEIEIGHTGTRNENIAKWWNEEGAGRSKKLRKWLYLTEAELKTIGETEF